MSMQYRRSPFAQTIGAVTSAEEERLADAEVRLYQAKLDALLGRRYDADEFDRVVEQYRSAKRIADEARIATMIARQAQRPAGPAGAPHPIAA